MKPQDEHGITERAAEWLILLESGEATAQDRENFGLWLLESPRNVEEALAVGAINRAYNGFDPEKRIPLMVPSGAAVVPLHEGALRDQHSGPLSLHLMQSRWLVGAALVLVAIVTGWGVLSGWFSDWQRYSTAVGEQRAFELSDGTIVHLNTHSEMRVRLSTAGRDIQLRTGEALFRVAPDANRPFRVRADNTVIQAVGTQFNVYRRAGGATTVAVLEGKVNISTAESGMPSPSPVDHTRSASTTASVDASTSATGTVRLAGGEGVRIAADGRVSKTETIDSGQVTAWRQRRLVFRKDRLVEVAAEFNRYNRNFQFRIQDQGIAERRLTGVFDADDPQSLLQFLASDPTLRFEKSGEGIMIQASAVSP